MSLIRSSLLVGLGAVASRVLGFVRDILFAQALGAGPVADAFLAAFRLPNLVRRIAAEGGLNPALIPALARLEPEERAKLAGDVITTFALGLLGLTALIEIGAGVIAFVLAPGLQGDDGTLALVALYTRLGFPTVIGVTLASLGAALLNMRGRYTATALAPLAVNLGLIGAIVILENANSLGVERKAIWLAVASSVSGFVQLVLVAVALFSPPPCGEGQGRGVSATLSKSGADTPTSNSSPQGGGGLGHSGGDVARFQKPRLSPALKSLLLAGLPALVASGAAQLFILVGTQIASFFPSGVSWLYYADRVVQLPVGLVAALGASVLLPEIALRHRGGDAKAIIAAQNRALEIALLLALPACAALAILAEPIAAVLFERGAFTPADTKGTALVLMGLSLGLPFATLGKVLSQTLFAQGSLRATLLATGLGIIVTIAAGLPLGAVFGMAGIAVGISLGCLAHAAALALLLKRVGLWAIDRPALAKLSRIAASTLIMSLGLAAALTFAPHANAATLTALCLGGLALYGASVFLTGAVTRAEMALFTKKP
ncbi:murein biosynthesis integral membrane protein MurJ [Microvirga terricola]|uniref:Probable lipid II flippase MurJ n=1 Tax=Microvirga terricola TaxID=2719797 RepID=A0ABX0VCL5_9HYPH|nr:oligosaccharide flippase family protein [Microvirga terricola]NIX75582.1 polysaccharide biosynthesis protein [Microvirga terricola]